MVKHYKELTKQDKNNIVKFYKTNSTLVTSEQFEITPDTLTQIKHTLFISNFKSS